MSKQVQPWQSLTAGLLAGGIEGAMTYPAEYLKTACQFSAKQGNPVSPVAVIKETFRHRGIGGFYSGCSALIVGNSAKAGVRFLTYDSIKSVLKHPETGKLSASGSLIAGVAAGTCEAIFAVTPSETVKTKLIDDAKRSEPRFRSTLNGVSIIVQEEGVAGIYRGLLPTIIKQSANSAVRFSSYNALKSSFASFSGGASNSSAATFACGAGAGVITVYATMPFDVLKTRMQALDASTRYKNSLDCFKKIIVEDGVTALWGGSTARLGRLVFSGGIVFTCYEKLIVMFQTLN